MLVQVEELLQVFNGRSDALVASLLYHHNLTHQAVQCFLDLLHNPKFKVAEVTLLSSVEIDTKVANHRRETRRSASELPLFPFPVLERIVDLGLEDLPHFDPDMVDIPVSERERIEERPLPPYPYRTHFLQALSLVHRSWTGVCQTRLGYRIASNGMKQLRTLLISPVLGPWTREVALSEKSRHTLDIQRSDEIADLIVMLLSRVPNIVSFSIVRYGFESTPGKVMTALTTLKHLRSLRWNTYYHSPPSLFISTITLLPSLTSLSLYKWSFDEFDPTTSSSPSFRLTSLSLVDVTLSPDQFRWLLSSSIDSDGQPTLRHLVFNTDKFVEFDGFMSVFKDIGGKVETLRVVCNGGMSPAITAVFPSLRVVWLSFYHPMMDVLLAVGPHVQEIHIHTTQPAEDQIIADMIQNPAFFPHLQLLHVYPVGANRLLEAACQVRQIHFKVSEFYIL